METIIKLKTSELTDSVIQKIKEFLYEVDDAEITIILKTLPTRRQSREEYFQQLDEAVKNVALKQNLVSFTLEEFENFAHSLSKK